MLWLICRFENSTKNTFIFEKIEIKDSFAIAQLCKRIKSNWFFFSFPWIFHCDQLTKENIWFRSNAAVCKFDGFPDDVLYIDRKKDEIILQPFYVLYLYDVYLAQICCRITIAALPHVFRVHVQQKKEKEKLHFIKFDGSMCGRTSFIHAKKWEHHFFRLNYVAIVKNSSKLEFRGCFMFAIFFSHKHSHIQVSEANGSIPTTKSIIRNEIHKTEKTSIEHWTTTKHKHIISFSLNFRTLRNGSLTSFLSQFIYFWSNIFVYDYVFISNVLGHIWIISKHCYKFNLFSLWNPQKCLEDFI